MIDIESLVFAPLSSAIKTEYENAIVTGEYVREPAGFPHISIVEADNYIPTALLDSADTERFAQLMYEVNIYSNKVKGKKSEARAILQIVDTIMYSLNFTRTVMTPVPNLEDASIYRLTARYSAVTDGEKIYRT